MPNRRSDTVVSLVRMLRTTAAAIALSAAPSLSCSLLAQQPQAQPYKPAGAAPKRVDLAQRVVEVPLLLLGAAPRVFPVVEAYVNGRGPYRFAIETGAEFATLTPKLATELKLARTGGPSGFPEYRVDSLSVGGATFRDFTVSELRTRSTDIDGLLGLPIYGDLLLTLDYPRRKLRLERGDLPVPDGRTVLGLTKGSRGHFWRLPIEVGGRTVQAVIDTRSSGTFGFTPAFVDSSRVRFEGDLVVVGMAAGAAIAPVEVKAGFLAGDVRIGRYSFPRPLADVRPLPPGFPDEPLVGTQVLQHFAMTLDQRNARVRLLHEGAAVIELPRPQLRAARRSALDSARAATSGGTTRAVRIDPKDYVGTWGDRTITFEQEQFYLQRPGGARYRLVPTGMDSFGIENVPDAAYRFVRDAAGHVIELRARNQDGQWETVKRTPAKP